MKSLLLLASLIYLAMWLTGLIPLPLPIALILIAPFLWVVADWFQP